MNDLPAIIDRFNNIIVQSNKFIAKKAVYILSRPKSEETRSLQLLLDFLQSRRVFRLDFSLRTDMRLDI